MGIAIMNSDNVTKVFNQENKITYYELAPSLQALIDAKATIVDLNAVTNRVTNLEKLIGDNRISITDNLGGIANPINSKELAINTANHVQYSYQNNGWVPMGGAYS